MLVFLPRIFLGKVLNFEGNRSRNGFDSKLPFGIGELESGSLLLHDDCHVYFDPERDGFESVPSKDSAERMNL